MDRCTEVLQAFLDEEASLYIANNLVDVFILLFYDVCEIYIICMGMVSSPPTPKTETEEPQVKFDDSWPEVANPQATAVCPAAPTESPATVIN